MNNLTLRIIIIIVRLILFCVISSATMSLGGNNRDWQYWTILLSAAAIQILSEWKGTLYV